LFTLGNARIIGVLLELGYIPFQHCRIRIVVDTHLAWHLFFFSSKSFCYRCKSCDGPKAVA